MQVSLAQRVTDFVGRVNRGIVAYAGAGRRAHSAVITAQTAETAGLPLSETTRANLKAMGISVAGQEEKV